tara:strand:- start:206 stop:787 length:582 start_codon:yes stop_codon:yes gene_type:complete
MNNIKPFFNNYVKKLFEALNTISIKNLDKASDEIRKTIKKNGTIYVCGNGGSAAIANHYVVDFLKFFREKSNLKPKIISFSNSIETISAISNDIDYKFIFKYQAETYCKKNDLIIIISSSGNSKNIIEIVKYAKNNKIKTIGFSGFKGGYLKRNSNISVHVNSQNYGMSEDSHHILMHLTLQYLIWKLSKKKN